MHRISSLFHFIGEKLNLFNNKFDTIDDKSISLNRALGPGTHTINLVGITGYTTGSRWIDLSVPLYMTPDVTRASVRSFTNVSLRRSNTGGYVGETPNLDLTAAVYDGSTGVVVMSNQPILRVWLDRTRTSYSESNWATNNTIVHGTATIVVDLS